MKSLSEQVKSSLTDAEEAIKSSSAARAKLRRKTKPDDPHRRAVLEVELERLVFAMGPIRSAIGKLAYNQIPEKQEERLRSVSLKLQRERQKVKKMLGLVPWN